MKKYILCSFLSIILLAISSQVASANVVSDQFCSFAYSPMGRGSRGEAVSGLQTLLRDGYGYSVSSTGFYGSITSAAVRQIQSDLGLATPGNVGPLTLASLRSTWCNESATNTTNTNTAQANIVLSQSSNNGDGTTLYWTTTGVRNCQLNGESVYTEGNRYVRVTSGTQYRLACQDNNNNNTIEQYTTVQANSNYNNYNNNNNNYNYNTSYYQPTLALSGAMYTQGQVGVCYAGTVSPCNGSGYITVSSTNATSCTLSGGIYNNTSITVNGSFNVSPTVPTRYSVTCSGNGGNTTQSIVLEPNTTNGANGTVTTNTNYYNTGNTISINWSAPSSYSSEVQGVLLELIKDGVSYGTISRITTGQSANTGRYDFIIPKALLDTRNDAISCTTINGETLCGNILRSGTYKIRATYFTPSNACFGFCQAVTSQRTLGTIESQNFTVQSSIQ
jgi:Putative peptidoglycan binding domain